MRLSQFLRLLALLLSLGAIAQAGAQGHLPLRVLITAAHVMPQAQFAEGRLSGGIQYDLAMEIGKVVNAPVAFLVMPRKRLEQAARDREFDLLCHTNPEWMSARGSYFWSQPLYPIKDVIVGHSDTPVATRLSDLPRGARVGAVLGYLYPPLADAFTEGKLVREDALDAHKVLLKVSAGRTPYAVVDEYAYDWYRRTTTPHRLADWRLVVVSSAAHCLVPKTSPWRAEELFSAINYLKSSGQVERILSRYR